MAIPVLVTTRETEELVWMGDPDVTPMAGQRGDLRGWIPARRAVVGDGADVLRVRALSGPEKFRLDIEDDVATRAFAACRTAVQGRRIGGEWVTDRRELATWIDGLPSGPVWELYTWILAVTRGADPQEVYAETVRQKEGASEESQPAPKSDG